MPGLEQHVHRYAIATFKFKELPPAAPAATEWDPQVMLGVFSAADVGIADFWSRCSVGILDLRFEIVTPNWMPFSTFTWNALQTASRATIIQTARADLAAAGISLDNYDHLIVAYPNGPSDAGALGQGGDLAMDLSGAGLAFLEHEIGHTLGFEHAFGPWTVQNGNVYSDPFDVMGYTGTNSHSIPVPSWAVGQTPDGFWLSERRLSAAAAFRYLGEDFGASGRVVQMLGTSGNATINGLATTVGPEPMLLVRRLAADDPTRHLTVEYRPAIGDDGGIIGPNVVVHTIGVNPVAPGLHEVNPSWFEGALAPAAGSTLDVPAAGLTVTVTDSDTGSTPQWVNIDVRPMKVGPFHPGPVEPLPIG